MIKRAILFSFRSLKAVFCELYRITKPSGRIVIIDKPVEKLGQLEIYEWNSGFQMMI